MGPLDGHNAGVYDNEMIVFGGFFGGKIGKYSNQVAKYNIQSKKWTVLFTNTQEVSN